jgi:hypothetical protein
VSEHALHLGDTRNFNIYFFFPSGKWEGS